MSTNPDFPRFYPDRATRCARRLMSGVGDDRGLLAEWSGLSLDRDLSRQLQFAVHAARLLGENFRVQTLVDSLDGLSGVLTPDRLETWCWRIGGNYERLLTDRPLIPGLVPTAEVEVPLEFVYSAMGWSKGRNPQLGAVVGCRVIDGVCCPLQVRQWLPFKYLYIVARELGISSRRVQFSGQAAALFGMRFLGVLTPGADGSVRWTRCRVGQFRSHNEQLRRRRKEPCPVQVPYPCHECSAGLDQCPAPKPRACRAVTLGERLCLVCDQSSTHDEEGCLRCFRRPPAGFFVKENPDDQRTPQERV